VPEASPESAARSSSPLTARSINHSTTASDAATASAPASPRSGESASMLEPAARSMRMRLPAMPSGERCAMR
jgi:hypothetical protein